MSDQRQAETVDRPLFAVPAQTLPRRKSTIGPTCPKCQTIHCSTDVIAVGRFDPNGVHGYMPRVGGCGCIYRTRDEAMALVCAGRAEGGR